MAFQNQGAIPVQLTMTLTLDEWKQLSSQLNGAWPGSKLSEHIRTMIGKASTIVWSESGDSEPHK